MQANFVVLDRRALHNEFKGIQAQLRLKGESAELLLMEKSSPVERTVEPERSFIAEFEDAQDDFKF